MNVAIVMITIDRSERGRKNYFHQTMESFRKSGLWVSRTSFSLHIYDSGSESLDYMGRWIEEPFVHLHSAHYKVPPKINAGRALLAGSGYDPDWVFFVEDDIDVCKNFFDGAAAFIEKYAMPQYRVISFYTPYREVEYATSRKEPFWEYPVPSFYGTQALAMRKEDAEACGRYLMTETNYDLNTPSYDLVIKDWHKTAYPDSPFFQSTVPSFVQHIGEDSYLLPGRFHTCGSFPGDQWSPL